VHRLVDERQPLARLVGVAIEVLVFAVLGDDRPEDEIAGLPVDPLAARRAAFSRRSVTDCSRRAGGSGVGTGARISGANGRAVSIMPRL
jgi:hypothetical protein